MPICLPRPPVNSVVRVLIDVAFAFLYFLSGVRGWLGNSLDLSNDPISSDPWFQNLLVPLLMVAPLWWRFQQNLRRSYETRQRYVRHQSRTVGISEISTFFSKESSSVLAAEIALHQGEGVLMCNAETLSLRRWRRQALSCSSNGPQRSQSVWPPIG